MFIIRPIEEKDLGTLESFAKSTSLGMISMPKSRPLLKQKIEHSLESFASKVKKPRKETYLFVMENLETGELGGSCGIYAKTAVDEPHYFYRVEIENRKSTLPIASELELLRPVSWENGPSELCGLFLSKRFRHGGLGKLLSLHRLLFIASHPERFDLMLLARLRGVIQNRKKQSPFWEALGHKFLRMPFYEALAKQEGGTSFIQEFLPKHPIYTCFLPAEARRVIGATFSTTKPAFKMLTQEGFQWNKEVDVFDAGPNLTAKREEVRTIRESRVATVGRIEKKEREQGAKQLVSTTGMDYRCCIANVAERKGKLVIDQATAKALRLDIGDKVRYARLHSQEKKEGV